jgi:hypothetical protein
MFCVNVYYQLSFNEPSARLELWLEFDFALGTKFLLEPFVDFLSLDLIDFIADAS